MTEGSSVDTRTSDSVRAGEAKVVVYRVGSAEGNGEIFAGLTMLMIVHNLFWLRMPPVC